MTTASGLLTAPVNPRVIVEVAFANNPLTPLASLTWTDITHWCQQITTSMGRTHENNQTETGRLTVRLVNIDGRFSPFNTNSPYYGPFTDGADTGVLGLVPMKRLRVRAVNTNLATPTTYPVWHGFIESWPQVWPDPSIRYVDVAATDAFKIFNLFNLSTSRYSGTVLADSPTGYWRLGDQVGSGSAADVSGNNHPGFVNTTVGFGAAGAFYTDATTSTAFTGTGYIDVTGGGPPAATATQSVEFWVNVPISMDTTDGTKSVLFQKVQQDFEVFANLIHDGSIYNGHVQFWVSPDNVTYLVADSANALNDGLWHHVVFTNDATSTTKLYVDGVQTSTFTGPAFSGILATTTMLIAGAIPASGGGGLLTNQGPQRGFNLQEVAVYPTTLTPTRVLAHYNAGNNFVAQSTDARVNAVLDMVGWPTADRNIETGGSSVMAPTSSLTTTSALTHLNAVVSAEGGIFFIATNGVATFYARGHTVTAATAKTSQVTLGEGGEPYELVGTAVGMDDLDIWNDVTASRTGGIAQRVFDLTSQARYGHRSLTGQTGLLNQTDFDCLDRANYLLDRYKAPVMRVNAVAVHPMADSTNLFPKVLGLGLLDRITVTRNAASATSTSYSQQANIEKVSHTIIPGGDWHTIWNLSPTDTAHYWILQDATFGVLDSTTKLFW